MVPVRLGLVLRDRDDRLLLHSGPAVLGRLLPHLSPAGPRSRLVHRRLPAGRDAGHYCGGRRRDRAVRGLGVPAAARAEREDRGRAPAALPVRLLPVRRDVCRRAVPAHGGRVVRPARTAPFLARRDRGSLRHGGTAGGDRGSHRARGADARAARRTGGRAGRHTRFGWLGDRDSGQPAPAGPRDPAAALAGARRAGLAVRPRCLVRLPVGDLRQPVGVCRRRVGPGLGPGRGPTHVVQGGVLRPPAALGRSRDRHAHPPGGGLPAGSAAAAAGLPPVRLGLSCLLPRRRGHSTHRHQGLHGHRALPARGLSGDGGRR